VGEEHQIFGSVLLGELSDGEGPKVRSGALEIGQELIPPAAASDDQREERSTP
jgi:hypothetical protein